MRTHTFTLAEVRKGMWPGPVYEGHFDDGTVGRMSFWSKTGKPFDFGRGRRVVGLCTPHRGKQMVAGYVERDVPGEPWMRVPDPFFTNGAVEHKAPRRRVTAKQLRTVLESLLNTLPLASETGGRNLTAAQIAQLYRTASEARALL